MRRTIARVALRLFALGLAHGLAAEGLLAEAPSLAVECAGAAYGLVVKSPRISLSGTIPVLRGLSLQASPTAAWGGENGSRSVEIALPISLRASFGSGALRPYAALGLETGWATFDGSGGLIAAGPTVEAGARIGLFGSGLFAEPYIGGAIMLSSDDMSPVVTPSLFGGFRIGLGL